MHLFAICLKPEKYLRHPMQTKGSFADGQSGGGDIPIPDAADCYVPDLFNGDSYCLLGIVSSGAFKEPRSITFLTVADVDYATALAMCPFYRNVLRFTPSNFRRANPHNQYRNPSP